MAFKLSQRSLDRLEGVHPQLVEVVKRAIQLTNVDFGVTCGTRTIEEQEKLVADGKSQTMNSKHLPQEDGYSHAVDLVAYVGSDVSWDLELYDDICDAMAKAAREVGLHVIWGAAWTEGDIRQYPYDAEAEMNSYIARRNEEGRSPFIDAPHFEALVV